MTLPLNSLKLSKIFIHKHSADDLNYLADSLNDVLPLYEIDTKERVAAFIAQCAHESVEFTRLKENMNYTAARLLIVFPKRVTPDVAVTLAGKPEAIGNYVYANMNGNGDVKSGDGYKYRGRGAIQLTGKNNYREVGEQLGLDLVGRPELIEEPYNAIHTACAYWQENDLNAIVDSGDFVKLTAKINRAKEGMKERVNYFNRAMAAL